MVCIPGEDHRVSLSLEVAHSPLVLAAGEGTWVQQRVCPFPGVPAGSSVGHMRDCECDQGGFDCQNPLLCSLGMPQATHMVFSSPSASFAASY